MDEEDQYGNWLYYGDDVEMKLPDGQVMAGRTNQLNNFNQDKLRGYMVTDFIDSFGNIKRNNTSTPSPSSSRKEKGNFANRPRSGEEMMYALENKLFDSRTGWTKGGKKAFDKWKGKSQDLTKSNNSSVL